jgi:hypothetical protein
MEQEKITQAAAHYSDHYSGPAGERCCECTYFRQSRLAFPGAEEGGRAGFTVYHCAKVTGVSILPEGHCDFFTRPPYLRRSELASVAVAILIVFGLVALYLQFAPL